MAGSPIRPKLVPRSAARPWSEFRENMHSPELPPVIRSDSYLHIRRGSTDGHRVKRQRLALPPPEQVRATNYTTPEPHPPPKVTKNDFLPIAPYFAPECDIRLPMPDGRSSKPVADYMKWVAGLTGPEAVTAIANAYNWYGRLDAAQTVFSFHLFKSVIETDSIGWQYFRDATNKGVMSDTFGDRYITPFKSKHNIALRLMTGRRKLVEGDHPWCTTDFFEYCLSAFMDITKTTIIDPLQKLSRQSHAALQKGESHPTPLDVLTRCLRRMIRRNAKHRPHQGLGGEQYVMPSDIQAVINRLHDSFELLDSEVVTANEQFGLFEDSYGLWWKNGVPVPSLAQLCIAGGRPRVSNTTPDPPIHIYTTSHYKRRHGIECLEPDDHTGAESASFLTPTPASRPTRAISVAAGSPDTTHPNSEETHDRVCTVSERGDDTVAGGHETYSEGNSNERAEDVPLSHDTNIDAPLRDKGLDQDQQGDEEDHPVGSREVEGDQTNDTDTTFDTITPSALNIINALCAKINTNRRCPDDTASNQTKRNLVVGEGKAIAGDMIITSSAEHAQRVPRDDITFSEAPRDRLDDDTSRGISAPYSAASAQTAASHPQSIHITDPEYRVLGGSKLSDRGGDVVTRVDVDIYDLSKRPSNSIVSDDAAGVGDVASPGAGSPPHSSVTDDGNSSDHVLDADLLLSPTQRLSSQISYTPPTPTAVIPFDSMTEVQRALFNIAKADVMTVNGSTSRGDATTTHDAFSSALQHWGVDASTDDLDLAINGLYEAARQAGGRDHLYWLTWLRAFRLAVGVRDNRAVGLQTALEKFRRSYGYQSNAMVSSSIGRQEIDYRDIVSLYVDEWHRGWLTDSIIRAIMLAFLTKFERDHPNVESRSLPYMTKPISIATNKESTYEKMMPPDQQGHVLIPIHHANHWFLVTIHPHTKTGGVIDSIEDARRLRIGIDVANKFILSLAAARDPSLWDLKRIPCQQQCDSNSCGVFMLFNILEVLGTSPTTTRRSTDFMRGYLAQVLIDELQPLEQPAISGSGTSMDPHCVIVDEAKGFHQPR